MVYKSNTIYHNVVKDFRIETRNMSLYIVKRAETCLMFAFKRIPLESVKYSF